MLAGSGTWSAISSMWVRAPACSFKVCELYELSLTSYVAGNVDALSGKGFLGVLVEMNMLVLFTVGVLI